MNQNTINKIDLQNMFDVIKNLYKHIDHSFKIINDFKIKKNKNYKNIIICGMGGSAIGADFVKTVLYKDIKLPIYVNRTYDFPSWVNKKDTLVIISSYSGETEEIVSCFDKTVLGKMQSIIISSGGYILNKAKMNKIPTIEIPKGIQPRAAFGYSASLLLLLFVKLGIAHKKYKQYLESSIKNIENKSKIYSILNNSNPAINFASKIFNKYPIIYGTPLTNIASLRLRCQLAENAKILSTHYILPEQNHNEIEGYLNYHNKNSVLIWINDIEDHLRIIKRIHITSKLLNEIKHQYFFNEEGKSFTERLFKLIYFFDWVSYYSSIYQRTNPTPVDRIKELKLLMS